MLEITKAEAIALIEGGSGYWSPQCHTPWSGATDRTVVFVCEKFYNMPKTEFEVKVHKVVHFDRSSMIIAHSLICNNEELGKIIEGELQRIAEITRNERWAQKFLSDIGMNSGVFVTPKQGRRWHNEYIVKPVDTGN